MTLKQAEMIQQFHKLKGQPRNGSKKEEKKMIKNK